MVGLVLFCLLVAQVASQNFLGNFAFIYSAGANQRPLVMALAIVSNEVRLSHRQY